MRMSLQGFVDIIKPEGHPLCKFGYSTFITIELFLYRNHFWCTVSVTKGMGVVVGEGDEELGDVEGSSWRGARDFGGGRV